VKTCLSLLAKPGAGSLNPLFVLCDVGRFTYQQGEVKLMVSAGRIAEAEPRT